MQAAEYGGKKCPYYGDLQRKHLYSVWMRESTDQKIFVIGLFSHNDSYDNSNTPCNTKNTKLYLVYLFYSNMQI